MTPSAAMRVQGGLGLAGQRVVGGRGLVGPLDDADGPGPSQHATGAPRPGTVGSS